MHAEVLSISGMKKAFGSNIVLDSVDLSLSQGTILGLVGRNGAGKSTLIKCALGLLHADEGEALIFGETCRQLSPKTKHRIGYVPQVFTGLGWMTVADLLKYTQSFYDHWNDAKVDTLVKDWGLDPHARVSTISEGEKQKLAIIQAMGHEPELFIFDEPVASLDPVARRTFIRELIELNVNDGRSMLFSTHITSDLERVAADVALLRNGVIEFDGGLEMLKDQVVRLHISSSNGLPEELNIPGAIRRTINESHAVVTVRNFNADLLAALEASLGADIRVEQLNLEEIFLELNR